MNEALLPFKYRSIKLEQQYDEKSIVSLGWKCRKYINWSAIHVDKDREILREFGDSAVDNKIIISRLLPRINAIMLNAQRWRLDKENWSIEPELEVSWKYTDGLLATAKENPGVVVSYLAEKIENIGRVKSTEFADIFQKIALLNVVKDKLKVNIDDYSLCVSSLSTYQILEKYIARDGAMNELEVLRGSSGIESDMQNFGLSFLDPDHDYSVYKLESVYEKQRFAIAFSELPLTKLYTYTNTLNNKVICLNANHSLIKKLIDDEKLMDVFIKYFEANIQSENDNPLLVRQFDDYNSYLSLTLNKYFQ